MKFNKDNQGNVWCANCGAFIGNFRTCPPKDKPRMRRIMYCSPECRLSVSNRQKKESKNRLKKPRKQLVDELYEQVFYLKEQNKNLRKMYLETRENIYSRKE